MNRVTDPSTEEVDKIDCIGVSRGNGQMDPQLAAAMQEIHEALRDPNSWDNSPDKQRDALEGLGKLLAEWQAENGGLHERGTRQSLREHVRRITIVLDVGALIALDRHDRETWSRLRTAFQNGRLVRDPAGVVGHARRAPNRQVLASRAWKQCDEVPLDGMTARASERLCGNADTPPIGYDFHNRS